MAVMERKIVQIDEEKCNGCELCVHACHEGAIQMVDGKARLVSDIYCDGLGDCLGPCPTGAISIITRPAEAYDEEAAAQRISSKEGIAPNGSPGTAARELKRKAPTTDAPCGCPGSATKASKPPKPPHPHASGTLACGCPGTMSRSLKVADACSGESGGNDVPVESELMNWPVQLKLVPPAAPYLKGADILMAADCTAFAVPNFHSRYLRHKPVIISCPKLEDNEPQIAKMAEIIRTAQPASIMVVRMEVPCCGGLVRNVEAAVRRSGIDVPVHTVVVGVDGSES